MLHFYYLGVVEITFLFWVLLYILSIETKDYLADDSDKYPYKYLVFPGEHRESGLSPTAPRLPTAQTTKDCPRW